MDRVADRTEVDNLLTRMTSAWDRNDAVAYDQCFTAHASYITFIGTVYLGRDDIARSHGALFNRFLKGSRMFTEVLRVEFIADDVAVVVSRGDVGKKRPKKLNKVQTFTAIRENGQWLVAAFHNTQRKSLMEKVGFRFTPETIPASSR